LILRLAESWRMVVDCGRALAFLLNGARTATGICLIQIDLASARGALRYGIGLAYHNAVIQLEGGGSWPGRNF
jgi:hypothetical protein